MRTHVGNPKEPSMRPKDYAKPLELSPSLAYGLFRHEESSGTTNIDGAVVLAVVEADATHFGSPAEPRASTPDALAVRLGAMSTAFTDLRFRLDELARNTEAMLARLAATSTPESETADTALLARLATTSPLEGD
jgi:hypothetical protein